MGEAKTLAKLEAATIRVEGLVQRVGFRRFAERLARSSKVVGSVENLRDGTVRIFAQGETGRIGEFVRRIREAPPPIEIDRVEVKKAKVVQSVRYFEVKTGPLALEMQEGFGGMEAQFRDYREEFRDYKKEFKDFAGRTDVNFKTIQDRYGQISEKLTAIMNAMMEESRKTSEMLAAMRSESKQTSETLSESLRLLRETVEKLPKAAG